MYINLKEAHNLLGMILLFGLFLIIMIILISFLRKKPFAKCSKITALIGLILIHTQVSIGFILYFLSPLGKNNFSAESMGHPISRFYMVEHPVGMILAAILITMGYSKAKKTGISSRGKYKRILIYYAIALLIIAYLIPWFLWS